MKSNRSIVASALFLALGSPEARGWRVVRSDTDAKTLDAIVVAARLAARRPEASIRIDNPPDRGLGSVIVSEGNRRYHEPGAGRGVRNDMRIHVDGTRQR